MKVDASRPQPFTPSETLTPSPGPAADATGQPAPELAPTLPLMHASHLLAGLATMLLGPILPILIRHWQLSDAQAGAMPLAQFIGATIGGITVSARLPRALLIGLISAAIGFFIFARAPTFPIALFGLLLGGFGVGRCIACINITGGARYARNRGAALSRLNFSWSFGALLSPLLAASLAPRFALPNLLTLFAAFFLACALALLFELRSPHALSAAALPTAPEPPLARTLFLYFAALLFVYGGLETCLNVWLTTYALRYGQSSLVLSQYTLVLLLCGLTAGRALAARLLLRMRETTLQRLALAVSAALAAVLATARTAAEIASLAVLLGIALAPIFPATFALLMALRPPARTAGIVLAASGLGAASLPWLMGVVSTRTGSLQVALALPVATALLMLLLSTRPPRISKPLPGV